MTGCSAKTMTRQDIFTVWKGNLNERNYLPDLNVDGRIKKQILKE